ncbi:834_t:CDS:2 [Ambispora gerdemannii]|uniref:834_t:CDS:1 n=1 Tax=Ambispora gerdemannii TaxID=144530 RepID=A0A9N8ZG34_9GLOM|nr:834_t:CDS:2 [Ambispora gerdemannii]
MKFAKEPIIPLRLFLEGGNVLAMFLASLFTGISFYALLYYVPLYFQTIMSVSAIVAGLKLSPLVAGIVIFSAVSDILTAHTGNYRIWILLGFALTTIGCGLLVTLDENSNQGKPIGYLFIAGSGLGSCMQTSLIVAQNAVDFKDVAVVTALCTFWRTTGGVLGVAI